MSKNKSKQTKEIKLMSPVWFLNQIFKLGITRGIERRWGSLFTCMLPPSMQVPQSSTTLPYHPTLRKSISLVRRCNKRNKIKWRMDENWVYKNESLNPKSFKLKWGYSDLRSCWRWCHPWGAFTASYQLWCHPFWEFLLPVADVAQPPAFFLFSDKSTLFSPPPSFSDVQIRFRKKIKKHENHKVTRKRGILKASWMEHDTLPQ